MRPRLLSLLFLFLTASALAYQDPAPIRKAVEDYLRIQSKGLSGNISFTVGSIDQNNQLPPCNGFQVRQDNGRLWGRVNLTVQCQAGASWSIFVPATIKVQGNYLVARRNLGTGQILTEADMELRQGDLTEFPDNLMDSYQQAVGKTLGVSLLAGQPLRHDALRQPIVVQQGQRVTIISKGTGFAVSGEGQAINNATEDQIVRVRLPNGQIVSGLAKVGGVVEITH